VPNDEFPVSYSLKITSRLIQEAEIMANEEAPSVFTLVSLLENEEELDKVIQGPEVSFSYALDLVPEHVKQLESSTTVGKSLNALNLGTARSHRNDGIQNTCSQGSKKEFQNKDLIEDNNRIKEHLKNRLEVPKLMKVRQQLPSWPERNKILKQIRSSQVVVISGMTGCGKSTQVPQYILDEWLSGDQTNGSHCNIVCTQPRRISAIGVAERVAAEREETVGSNKGLIGYQIRMESKISSWTRLLFCTTGILLRRLESDPNLRGTTHLVIDEVHERSEQSDFLLMILRDLLPKRPELRIILMSATLNAQLFAQYFERKFLKGELKVPIIDIPGRTFPVEQLYLEDILDLTEYALEENSKYARSQEEFSQKFSSSNQSFLTTKSLKGVADYVDQRDLDFMNNDSLNCKAPNDKKRDEQIAPQQVIQRYTGKCSHDALKILSLMDFNKIDYDLIEKTLCFIVDEHSHDYPTTGSILVFLPGLAEIMNLHEQLSNHPTFGSRAGRFKLLPLHSSLTSEEQAAIFQKPKPSYVRKIILSTNLAETSITIDDCVFVVDAGRMKENRFDPTKNMESLDTVWVSKANALQRKGRAGRVMSGVCFHLYTKFRYDKHFRNDPTPEIQRVPLEQMILRIKILPIFGNSRDSKIILSKMIEPPENVSIETAETRLSGVGALDGKRELTPLGFHLAALPVDVRIGKLILFGAVFRCLDSALTIAAALSYRSPFVAPFGKREEAQKKKIYFSQRNSDHIAMLRAYQGWASACKLGGRAGYVFAQENYLSFKTMQMLANMKHQFTELLSGIGFVGKDINVKRLERAARGPGTGPDGVLSVTGAELNTNNNNYKVVVSVLAAALYPHVVQILSPETKYMQTAGGAIVKPPSVEDMKFRTKEDGFVNIHPSSVNAKASRYENSYMVYHEKVKTSRVFVRELSMVPIYPMVLFGGGDGVKVQLQRGKFVLSMEDGWIKFVTESHKVAECLKEMRSELDKLLEEKIKHPTLDLSSNGRGKLVINTLVSLLSKE
jgi:ATP-dependent RNA helicase DHX57